MDFSSLISARLVEERKRLNLNQAEAGAVCGVSREMWGKYERGKAVMGTEVLAKFATTNADVLYILTGQRSGTSTLKPEEEALVDNYRNCTPEGQKIVRAASSAGAKQEVKGKAA
jgi:transcriptional regulator with XRE-family HTH domain